MSAFPYRLFAKTHKIITLAYMALAFHTVVLLRFRYWSEPVGWLTALLLLGGFAAGVIALFGLIAFSRKVKGRIAALNYLDGIRALETTIAVSEQWPGHKAGQFAFAISDAAPGGHPYTIASAWQPENKSVTFVIKELGEHTSRLRELWHVGMPVTIEGPYGTFIFNDDCPQQIWIGAGIGITPFLARLDHMVLQKSAPDWPPGQQAHLFHSTANVDETALSKLVANADAADVRLHILVDQQGRGRLTGARIREEVPDWREASIWFCGPVGFGAALRRDFAAQGFPVKRRFHQELFSMR